MAMNLLWQKLDVATEAIQFQKDDFGERIAFEVEGICKAIDTNKYSLPFAKDRCAKISSIIFDRLGLKIKFVLDEGGLSSILVLYRFDLNVLDKFKYNKGRLLISSDIDGYVDTEKAKVGGGFSTITSILYFDFVYYRKAFNLSSREMTAIILHEIGHAFASFEYSKRLESNNQVLSEVAAALKEDNYKDKKQFVYKKLKKISYDIDNEELDKLLTEDQTMVSIHLLKCMFNNGKMNLSQLPNIKYNSTSSEQLADNFAVKFGFGKELSEGLEKATKDNRVSIDILSYSSAIITLVVLGTTVSWPVSILVALTMCLFSGDNYRDFTYDDVKVRYQRVRSTIVNSLKSKQLDKEDVKIILDNIKAMDKLIKDASGSIELFRIIGNFIWPSNRRTRSDIEEQKLRELLASNDLFVRAAEFRLMK